MKKLINKQTGRRKPAAIAEKDGSWKKNPARRRKDPECYGNISVKPPSDLSAPVKQVWKELVKKAPKEILKDADEESFRLLCNLSQMARVTDVDNISVGKINSLITLFNLFGMTPFGRVKLAVTVGAKGKDKKKENPFEVIKAETDKIKSNQKEGTMLQ